MNSYRDLDIYKLAFNLAVRVHKTSLTLPNFELFEQGGQIMHPATATIRLIRLLLKPVSQFIPE